MGRVYKRFFSRDFTLAFIQIWGDVEGSPVKPWTNAILPYQPYILFERDEQTVHCYMDPEGVEWIKKELEHQAQKPGFVHDIKKRFLNTFQELKQTSTPRNPAALKSFLYQLRKVWVWFEPLWWLIEIFEEQPQGEELLELRKNAELLGVGSDETIRKALDHLYPSLNGRYQLLIEEVENPPSQTVLSSRQRFFYTNKELYITSRHVIEEHYKIKIEEPSLSTELTGQPVYPGLIRGTAKVIYSGRESKKVKKGDILIAPMTLPDMLPAMEKAAAFVTDEGGILCHAAIVARELKKPCVIATRIATSVFKDGDVVEVDAEQGVVKKIGAPPSE